MLAPKKIMGGGVKVGKCDYGGDEVNKNLILGSGGACVIQLYAIQL